MKQIKANKITYIGLMATLAVALFLSACGGGGDSGGSTAGTGTSSVEGNMTSVTLAWMQPTDSNEFSIAHFFRSLLPLQSAIADNPVEGVSVAIGQLGTMTNSSGYYRIDGVPAGTHTIAYAKNGQTASTTVTVGENQLVSMQNVRMNGSQVHVQNTGYQNMGGGTPGSGMPR
jgi:hypothetical protein